MSLPVNSTAMDRDWYDQSISGTDPVVLEQVQVLWDTQGDYNQNNFQLDVVDDGVRLVDIKLKLKDITDCTKIELGLYKKDSPDIFWFIIDSRTITTQTQIQMGGAITTDMYYGESYCISIKLTGSSPSCTIDHDTTYTAWTWTFLHQL